MSRTPYYHATPPTLADGSVAETQPTDQYGAPLVSMSPAASPGSSSMTSVAVSASSFSVLPANSARKGVIIENDSSITVYLLLSPGTASSTNKSMTLNPGDVYEMFGIGSYSGAITAIGASASGSLRVTEFS